MYRTYGVSVCMYVCMYVVYLNALPHHPSPLPGEKKGKKYVLKNFKKKEKKGGGMHRSLNEQCPFLCRSILG